MVPVNTMLKVVQIAMQQITIQQLKWMMVPVNIHLMRVVWMSMQQIMIQRQK